MSGHVVGAYDNKLPVSRSTGHSCSDFVCTTMDHGEDSEEKMASKGPDQTDATPGRGKEHSMLESALSPDEVEAFNREGYLIPSFRLSENDLHTLQRLTVKLMTDNPTIRGGIRSPHIADYDCSQRVLDHAGWLAVATHPGLLSIAEQLIGPQIAIWTSRLFNKWPSEQATPWHRDDQYRGHTAIPNVTVWIAVFDVAKENGALRVIPRSHRHQGLNTFGADNPGPDGELCLTETEASMAVDVQLLAGQMMFFDVTTIHSSWPNASSSVRAGYAVRYVPASDHSSSDSGVRLISVSPSAARWTWS